jgi:hypothetical protein
MCAPMTRTASCSASIPPPSAPDPEKIGKTESHGCIRLTNWDALDLAGIVHKGTVVKFVEEDTAAGSQAAK